MKKGEITRERIIEQTAPLFNKAGFFGASMSDIMATTGLKKGGIYNHFESKEELALEAFDHATSCISKRVTALMGTKTGAVERLLAYSQLFIDLLTDPPIAGGCPILNTAVESDDAHPALRERAQLALNRTRARITGIVTEGMTTGELRSDLDPDVVATRIIATLEGGQMMSRLYRDPTHVQRAVDFVKEYVERDLTA